MKPDVLAAMVKRVHEQVTTKLHGLVIMSKIKHYGPYDLAIHKMKKVSESYPHVVVAVGFRFTVSGHRGERITVYEEQLSTEAEVTMFCKAYFETYMKAPE